MPSVSFFVCHISACKFMLAYIYTHDCNVTWGGGRGLFKKFIVAEKCFVVSEKFMEIFEKK